jgi:hypothetical protein
VDFARGASLAGFSPTKANRFPLVGASLLANVRLLQCSFNGTIRLQESSYKYKPSSPCRSQPAGECSPEVMPVARHDSLAGLSPTNTSRFPL